MEAERAKKYLDGIRAACESLHAADQRYLTRLRPGGKLVRVAKRAALAVPFVGFVIDLAMDEALAYLEDDLVQWAKTISAAGPQIADRQQGFRNGVARAVVALETQDCLSAAGAATTLDGSFENLQADLQKTCDALINITRRMHTYTELYDHYSRQLNGMRQMAADVAGLARGLRALANERELMRR